MENTQQLNPLAEDLKRRARGDGDDRPDIRLLAGGLGALTERAERLPDGRKLKRLSNEELADALVELDIVGASRSNTRPANIALYELFICASSRRAGSKPWIPCTF